MTVDAIPNAEAAPAAPPPQPVLAILYAGAVVVTALYFGRDLVVPLVLASLLAFVLAPACRLLQRSRLPRAVAVIVVVLLAFAVMGGIGSVVGRQAAALAGNLPSYEDTVLGKWRALGEGDGLMARAVRGAFPAPAGGTKQPAPGGDDPASLLGLGGSGLSVARSLAQPLLGPLATGGIVLVFTIFIMLASEDIRNRLIRLVGRHDLHRTMLAMTDAGRRLSQYFLYQLGLNTGFGLLIGLSLWAAGLPNPLLWGILSALMRFVPYVGVPIALGPPLLLAVAVVPGWSLALLVLVLFLGAELVMGQVVEPLIYGHSTGLSPLAVIVATAFWTLLWGPIGLLLATPLTVCLVVVGRHVKALAFFDVILGDKPPLDPPETLYQRTLEGNVRALVDEARKGIKATSLVDYYDTVALPGLALAQRDLVRDALAFERLEAIHGQVETLLARVAEEQAARTTDPHAPVTLSPAWRDARILCVPGRGQLDDLAATMAVQGLAGAGLHAQLEPNLTLGPASAGDLSGVRLCCLSVLEDGSSVSSIRYFILRAKKRMPDALIVVGLWHADGASAMLAALRSEGDNEHIVLSIGELLTLIKALAAGGEPHAAAPASAGPVTDLQRSDTRASSRA